MANEQEEHKIVSGFLDDEYRPAALSLIGNAECRSEFVQIVANAESIDSSYMQRLPSADDIDQKVIQMLIALGAPVRCYIVSEDQDIDGSTEELESVIPRIIGSEYATLVSCIPGKLGFYESENEDERYIVRVR